MNIGVIGGACWPKKETVVTFDGHELILKPATKDTEQSIHINLHRKISSIDAMTLIHRFLSVLSWCDDHGMEFMEGWSGNPIPVAVPKRKRYIGSSIAFLFYRDVPKDPQAKLALALYREGLIVNSIPFSFLSYFKIINIFWKDKFQNRKNDLIEGIRSILPQIKDQMSLERLNELKKTESDIPKYLYESGRCAIAHAYSSPIVDPDDVTHLRRLSQDRWIIQAIARYLIEHKLGISRSIIG